MKPSDAADNLSQHRVPGPPEAYYIADFVTEEEEHYLLRKVCSRYPLKKKIQPFSHPTKKKLRSLRRLNINGRTWPIGGMFRPQNPMDATKRAFHTRHRAGCRYGVGLLWHPYGMPLIVDFLPRPARW
jgi:hypothetical protein